MVVEWSYLSNLTNCRVHRLIAIAHVSTHKQKDAALSKRIAIGQCAGAGKESIN